MSQEQKRIDDHYKLSDKWLKWGPYISERQWGTVREDYSADGEAWEYLSHDMARSKAYRWGEEGIGGFSDDKQKICLALGLWNGKDPILKERLFGLTNKEGNHGEDVKELYYYLDSTPTHSYMKMLYKYPQNPYPYQLLIDENAKRNRLEPEFELIDTGIFDRDEYFDIFIEYAKNDTEDILIKYTIENHSENDALLHFLPQIWFRNDWRYDDKREKPSITKRDDGTLVIKLSGQHSYYCFSSGDNRVLFTDNETNIEKLYGAGNFSKFVKDGIHEHVVNGRTDLTNPDPVGTKAAIWHELRFKGKERISVNLRLSSKDIKKPFAGFEKLFSKRKAEADEFYEEKQIKVSDADERMVQRQAWAGMLWSKQYFYYDVNTWLTGDLNQIPPPKERLKGRNAKWRHFLSDNIISMPDKWEYPWFAAWDLAFHCMALAPLDVEFAKNQLLLLVDDRFIHPNGQLPAYEWDFGDANPPVHAMAALNIYHQVKSLKGSADIDFLEAVFQKLLINFTWWVNQKDSEGNNIFEGGFLGLDNIGVFNRSAPVPGGGVLEQADGTSWMAMYALNMLQISNELAMFNDVYERLSIKFAEHFLFIAGSMKAMGEDSIGLWDEQDEFYYDLLRKPDGDWDRLRLRSMVGLIPMFAVIVFSDSKWENLTQLKARLDELIENRPDLTELVSHWKDTNGEQQHLFSLLRGHRMKRLLSRMLDENEFLSDYGIRSVSAIYRQHPFSYLVEETELSVHYNPGESETGMFGGNSNWRGPVWMPLNYMIIDALYKFYDYYTEDFKVEYPTLSGEFYSLAEIAGFLAERLKNIFLRDDKGERAVFGGNKRFNFDPAFKDYVLFHEYFHGDNGKGLGASHQTGWTGLISLLIEGRK